MTLMAVKESEAIELDTPEDYTNLKEYDDLNSGDISYFTITLTSSAQDLLEDDALLVKA
jgi:hypothetical protein